jgi:hypothetical protein
MDVLPGMAHARVWKACWQCDAAAPLDCTVERHGYILPFMGLMAVVPGAGKHAGAPRTQEHRAWHDRIAQ